MLRIKVKNVFKKLGLIALVLLILYVIMRLGFSLTEKDDQNETNIVKEELINKNTSVFQEIKLKKDIIEDIDSFIYFLMQDFNNHNFSNILEKMKDEYKSKFDVTNDSIKKYCELKFEQNKLYNYQLLTSIDNYYVYKINIYDDIISTGINDYDDYNNETIILVISNENNEYKFSLNEYIDTIEYNKKITTEKAICTLIEKEVYYKKEIIKCKIKNITEDIMILNTSTDIFNILLNVEYDTYIDNIQVSDRSNMFINDLIVYPNEEKEYVFEFNNKYFDNKNYVEKSKLVIKDILLVNNETINIVENLEKINDGSIQIKDYLNIELIVDSK